MIRTLALPLIAATSSCVDAPTSRTAVTRGTLALSAAFSGDAAATAARLADFGIQYDHVQVIVVRPIADTIYNQRVDFRPGQADITLTIPVQVHSDGETFNVTLRFSDASTVYFAGTDRVASRPSNDAAQPPTPIHVDYVGPGVTVTRLVIAAHPLALSTLATLTLSAQGFDAAGNAQTVPIEWTSSDPNLAKVTSPGTTSTITPTGRRGTVTITASTPSGVSDQASITLVPPAAAIALVSGGGQTGTVGSPLPNPAVFEVRAADGLAVPNISVSFTPPSGGAVSPTTAVTDANGRVSVTLTLGRVAGPQAFSASAGTFSAAAPATALPGVAGAIVAVSGGGQADTVRKTLAAPFVVRVTDQFSNPIPNATVNWSRTGAGLLSAATSVTGADGTASVGYTLGAVVGAETITASTAGVATPATFVVTAIAAAPSAIALVSGNTQSAVVNNALANPLVVRVTDGAGLSVANAVVTWSASNGTAGASTSTTDASGQASMTLRVGTVAGAVSATASIVAGGVSRTVTFSATAVAGPLSAIQFRTQPSNAVAGAAIAPAMQVALIDGFGNLITAATPVTLSLSGGTAGAILGGTFTRNAAGGLGTFADLTVDRAGTGYRLTATAGAAQSLSNTFNVTAVAGNSLVKLAGDNQDAVAGTAVSQRPSVRVVDGSGNPVSGATVTFTPASGSGAVTGGTVTTGTDGIATVGSWTVGSSAGPNTLTASSAGTASVTFAVNVTGGTTPGIRLNIGALGSGSTMSVAAGQDFTIPVTLDLTNRGADDIASISMTLTWDPARLTFRGQTVGNWVDSNGGASSLTVNTSNAASGSIQIAGYTTAATLASFVLSNIEFGANATGVAVPVNIGASVQAAGNAAGSAITVGLRLLVVTVTP